MTLLDSNVVIYASQPGSVHHAWARWIISRAVASDGAAVNAVCLAELCVGDEHPLTLRGRVRAWGVATLDVPVAAAEVCAQAVSRAQAPPVREGFTAGAATGFLHRRTRGDHGVAAGDGRYE